MLKTFCRERSGMTRENGELFFETPRYTKLGRSIFPHDNSRGAKLGPFASHKCKGDVKFTRALLLKWQLISRLRPDLEERTTDTGSLHSRSSRRRSSMHLKMIGLLFSLPPNAVDSARITITPAQAKRGEGRHPADLGDSCHGWRASAFN